MQKYFFMMLGLNAYCVLYLLAIRVPSLLSDQMFTGSNPSSKHFGLSNWKLSGAELICTDRELNFNQDWFGLISKQSRINSWRPPGHCCRCRRVVRRWRLNRRNFDRRFNLKHFHHNSNSNNNFGLSSTSCMESKNFNPPKHGDLKYSLIRNLPSVLLEQGKTKQTIHNLHDTQLLG